VLRPGPVAVRVAAASIRSDGIGIRLYASSAGRSTGRLGRVVVWAPAGVHSRVRRRRVDTLDPCRGRREVETLGLTRRGFRGSSSPLWEREYLRLPSSYDQWSIQRSPSQPCCLLTGGRVASIRQKAYSGEADQMSGVRRVLTASIPLDSNVGAV